MEEIRISVRSLVEFILRSGDIDNRHGMPADKEAMQLGSRLHREIQGQMGKAYQAEVPLKTLWHCEDYAISVEGRADGIFPMTVGNAPDLPEEIFQAVAEADGLMFVDEIKGSYRSPARMEEPVPVHLAQAKCYAYIYGVSHGLKNMGVQMTYCNLETKETRRFHQIFSVDELTAWFSAVMEEYQKWCDFQQSWKKVRQASIPEVPFPFPYREGQKDMAAAVYRTIARKKKIFIQASTGVGKTISTVFPAVKAVGQGIGDKIFYLTAKTITRTVAQDAFALLKEKGLKYKVITLTAKEKICPLEETDCNPLHCPRARGHFDRINDAVFEMLNEECDFTREAVEAYAEKRNVCPFEMSLDLAAWMDAVICDYNYVFDPRARLKRFFGEGVRGDYLFLIDEAHNLVERGREMFSASLYKEDFLELKREVQPYNRKLSRQLETCNRMMLEWKRESDSWRLLDSTGAFPAALMNLTGMLEDFMEELTDRDLGKKVLDFYYQVSKFLDIYERVDENYRIYTDFSEDSRFFIRLYCINTAVNLQECLDKGSSTVFFSATLLPVRYYMGLLCKDTDCYAIYAESSFRPENRLVLMGLDVSSRYSRRGPREYAKIAAYIQAMVSGREGNYMVFCPSYRMLQEISQAYMEICEPRTEIICQKPGMSETDREEFLAKFSRETPHTLVGFGVMGGVFGEGIDLTGERLIGAAIVGAGLPQVCSEREILKDFYNAAGADGFSYAYIYPGMNKVLQSAGRVIRTAADRGVILLLDERFGQTAYRSLFPREWAESSPCSLKNVGEKIKRFWRS